MSKTLFIIPERCVACKSCEIACAVEHSRSKTLVGAMMETPPPQPRIHIEAVGAFSYPARCQHCSEASCVSACPTGAMQRDTHNAVFSDSDKCIGCWMCVIVCPFGGVTADQSSQKALKCDRCPDRTAQGEAPACVSACPTQALLYVTPEAFAAERRQAAAQAAFAGEQPAQPNGMDILRSLKRAH